MNGRFRLCSAAAALTVGIALALAPIALARSATRTVYARAVTGTLKPVHARVLRPHLASSAVVPAAFAASRGVRRIPRSQSTAAPAATAPPQASAKALSTTSTPLLANFNGVSSRDSAVTNFGQEFEPPDQGLCAGNGFVVEMVNSAYTVYRPNGTVVTGPFNVNGPFDEGLTEFTSDPRCQYDAATHTWFASILFISADNKSSHEDLAVNSSGDPTTPWTTYRIDTTDTGGKTGPKHPGCPCFGDQPTLGIDSSNVYITTNEFSILGPQFNGAQIYAIAKSDLITPQPQPPSTPAHFVHFDKLSIGGTVAASVQPALTTGNAPAEFFLNSLDPNGTFDQRIGVWAMTNRGVVATGGKPTLSSEVISTEAYGVPPQAEQKGSQTLIDSGDDRMQQVQYIGGDVWGALDTLAHDPQRFRGSRRRGLVRCPPDDQQRPDLDRAAAPAGLRRAGRQLPAVSGHSGYAVGQGGDGRDADRRTGVPERLLHDAAQRDGHFVRERQRRRRRFGAIRRRHAHHALGRLFMGRPRPVRHVGVDGDRVRAAEVEPDPGRSQELGGLG